MAIIKYAIADDHKIFRQGLKLALSDDHKLKCIGEAASGDELLALLEKQLPDVILLDLKMPGKGGAEVMEEIIGKYPGVKILVLTMYDDAHFIIQLMENGAKGYLLKNAEPDEIKLAMHTVVYKNKTYFSDLVSDTLLNDRIEKAKTPFEVSEAIQLNENEMKILQMICKQYTAAKIAKEVFLAKRTVEGIRSGLLEKTGAKNTAGLVLYAIKHGLVEL